MKKYIVLTVIAMVTMNSQAATISAMSFAEKAAHQVTSLMKKGAVDKSIVLDLKTVTMKPSPQGETVVLSTQTAKAGATNTLTIEFNAAGKVVSSTPAFKEAAAVTPIFTKANADTVFDLGAEAVVDHVKDSAEIAFVAEHATQIDFAQDAKGISMNITLDDKRIYNVTMDLDGNVLSKGMK